MIFGFGKSRRKERPTDDSRELAPAIVCKHVLEGMKGGEDVNFSLSRDEEGDVSAMCEACAQVDFDPANFNVVAEGQALSYAEGHGVGL